MTDHQVPPQQSALKELLEQENIVRVAIVDDMVDLLDTLALSSPQREDLWERIESLPAAFAEIGQLGWDLSSSNAPTDLTDDCVRSLLQKRSQCPSFIEAWVGSDAGLQIDSGLRQVQDIVDNLEAIQGLDVKTFASDVEAEEVVAHDPQLIFLDWYLGEEAAPPVQEAIKTGVIPDPVKEAVEKAQAILDCWPGDKLYPLVILMSSRSWVEDHASEFCQLSGILRGMFHAVPKSRLTDSFQLRRHMHLFAMSLSPGRLVQKFVSALREKFKEVEAQFLGNISDLTLTDYAYIQSLSLQDDGQPLGDYLFWLLSGHLGQLLFSEALGEARADLDSMTFGQHLPNVGAPSDRLTEFYYSALFDTKVGPIAAHPQASSDSPTDNNTPALSLGDLLLRLEKPLHDEEGGDGCSGGEHNSEGQEEASVKEKMPDLFLLINPQCDLQFTPDSEERPADPNRSVLLLPGSLEPLQTTKGNQSRLKTELYLHGGKSHRIEWDPKSVRAVSLGEFDAWKTGDRYEYERSARLRLPFALELQRAFAENLTRIGAPVMPPIYQPVSASLLVPKPDERVYQKVEELPEGAVYLVLTREGPQCVLTFPSIVRVKEFLETRLEEMHQELQSENAGPHLQDRIDALARAIFNDGEWARLQSPFKLVGRFFNDRVQVIRGGIEGKGCDSNVVVAVSII